MQQHALQGKTALVCGASEGIGRASAIGLAEQGANIILLARRPKVLDEVRNALPLVAEGQQHHYMMADVSDAEGLKHKLDDMMKAFKIDILINNTAGPAGGAANTATPEQYLTVFQQHLIANQILLQAVLPNMKDRQWGRIINIISTSVKEPIANLGVSNTIRGAVASWSKTLASELGPFGITVNNILPGYTKTQRLGQILEERSKAEAVSVRRHPDFCDGRRLWHAPECVRFVFALCDWRARRRDAPLRFPDRASCCRHDSRPAGRGAIA